MLNSIKATNSQRPITTLVEKNLERIQKRYNLFKL